MGETRVEINEDKSRMVDLKKGEGFSSLGFEYRRILLPSGELAAERSAQAEEAGSAV
jgi:hypothetical protein